MSQTPNPLSDLLRSGRAATYSLIGLLGVAYVLAWLTKAPVFGPGMAFDGNWSHPWTAITYPFASLGIGSNLFWELLLLMWLYWIGTDLERAIGAAKLFAFFFGATVLGAACVNLAWLLTNHINYPLAGSIIPIGALTVAWGTRNPTACVRLWMVIPITGKWIAILEVGLVLFAVGDGNPAAGVFALVPLALAWAFAGGRLPGFSSVRRSQTPPSAKATERMSDSYYDDVRRREKDRAERERLRKLFEDSINEDK